MIIIPLIAVPLAVAIQNLRAARVVFVPLLAVSIVFAVAAVRNFGLLYPSDVQHIVGMRSTAPAFPSLAGVQAPVSFTLASNGPPKPETGKVEGVQVVARAGRDKRGFMRFGPYAGLKPGAYVATFSLAANGVGPDEPVAIIEVTAGAASYASKVLTGRQLLPVHLSYIDLPFANPGGLLETRVYYRGRGTVRVGPINVQPIVPPQPLSRFRDWPLAFCWVAGTFLVGWLFVQVMTLSRQRVTLSEENSEHSDGPGAPLS
jgi:hypothetical protein